MEVKNNEINQKHKEQVSSPARIEDINSQPFVLSFSGQGFDWISMLRSTLTAEVEQEITQLVTSVEKILEPIIETLNSHRPDGFKPVAWAKSADAEVDLLRAAVSVPGIFLSQIANIKALQKQGLEVASAMTAIGHSQGILGCYLVDDLAQAAQILAIAELVGVAATHYGNVNGMVIKDGLHPMVMIQGVEKTVLQNTIDTLFPKDSTDALVRPCIGLINSPSAFVVTGQPESVNKVCDTLVAQQLVDSENVESMIVPLDVEIGFHHSSLAAAVSQVVDWAETCGLDSKQAKIIAQNVLVAPVDWVKQCQEVVNQGAKYILEIGPSGGVAALTATILEGQEVEVLDLSNEEGKKLLFG